MKPTILLLGTVHLGNPDNDDAFKMEVEGIQTEKRQKELTEVITCLKRFKPTKIGVEILKEQGSKLNSELEQYLHGTFDLTNYEQHQIGFRLAEQMNLTEIHAVDWNKTRWGKSMDMGRETSVGIVPGTSRVRAKVDGNFQ